MIRPNSIVTRPATETLGVQLSVLFATERACLLARCCREFSTPELPTFLHVQGDDDV